MKIALTGGAGFIGKRLANQLKEDGHDVVIIDINDTKNPVDVCDLQALTQAMQGCEAIYHLAAEHRDDVRPIQKYYDVNVGGAENVVQAAKANNINKIIFTSTVAVYGLNAGESKETDAPSPFNDYGRSKLESEKVFDAWAAADPARSLVTIRLVATFGPGNRGNIYTLISQIARNRFVMIGSGRNRKSIAYVANVAAFLAQMLDQPAGQHLYNYADKPDLQTAKLVQSTRRALGFKGAGPWAPYAFGIIGGFIFDVAAQMTGKTFPISAIRVRKFCADTVVNADRAQAIFKAPYSLEQGLNEMVEKEFK